MEGTQTVRGDLAVVTGGRLTPWLPWSGVPKARTLALAQMAAGFASAALGPATPQRRPALTARALLPAHGALGLSYDLTHLRD
ncbi:hypothetical protein [Streptomyces sp. NPDC050759]|uniref:hypothetical protein n=1 Tax=Streptomyces sp. NPDC050759 TaxID=3365635 RepID=UPI00378D563C